MALSEVPSRPSSCQMQAVGNRRITMLLLWFLHACLFAAAPGVFSLQLFSTPTDLAPLGATARMLRRAGVSII